MARRTWILSLLVAAALSAALAWGFLPRPLAVETALVQRGPLAVTLEEDGATRVRDRYAVAAPAAGFARRVDLKVGDPVRAGQVLARLDPLPAAVLDPRARAQARARVAAARAALDRAGRDLDAAAAEQALARTELARTRELFQGGVLAQDNLDQAETLARTAAARLAAARAARTAAGHDLEEAQAALGHSAAAAPGPAAETVAVASPVDGRVLAVLHESEGPVAEGEPLLEVGDPNDLEVEVDVLSADAVGIAPGMPVAFARWGGDGDLEGRVRRVEPVGHTKISALGVEEQRVLVIVDPVGRPEAWARLGHGYRVEARFALHSLEDALLVPESALFRHAGGWAAYLARQGRARLVPVEVGLRTGLFAQVLSGLAAGDAVITHPGDDLADGVRVRQERP